VERASLARPTLSGVNDRALATADEHEHEKIHKDRRFLQNGTKGKASMVT
jgi:hypothetical protein